MWLLHLPKITTFLKTKHIRKSLHLYTFFSLSVAPILSDYRDQTGAIDSCLLSSPCWCHANRKCVFWQSDNKEETVRSNNGTSLDKKKKGNKATNTVGFSQTGLQWYSGGGVEGTHSLLESNSGKNKWQKDTPPKKGAETSQVHKIEKGNSTTQPIQYHSVYH